MPTDDRSASPSTRDSSLHVREAPRDPKPAPTNPAPDVPEEPSFADEPDLPPGEPSGAPTRNTKERLPGER